MNKYAPSHPTNGARKFGATKSQYSWTPAKGHVAQTAVSREHRQNVNVQQAGASRYRFVRNGNSSLKNGTEGAKSATQQVGTQAKVLAEPARASRLNVNHALSQKGQTVKPHSASPSQVPTNRPVDQNGPPLKRINSSSVSNSLPKAALTPSEAQAAAVSIPALKASKESDVDHSTVVKPVTQVDTPPNNITVPNRSIVTAKPVPATIATSKAVTTPAVVNAKKAAVLRRSRFSLVRRREGEPEVVRSFSAKRNSANKPQLSSPSVKSNTAERSDNPRSLSAQSNRAVAAKRPRVEDDRRLESRGAYKLVVRRRQLSISSTAQLNRAASWYVKTKYKKMNVAPKAKRKRMLWNVPCCFFVRSGTCKSGSSCPFLHAVAPVRSRSSVSCEMFEKLGLCPLGTRCTKRHTLHLDLASISGGDGNNDTKAQSRIVKRQLSSSETHSDADCSSNDSDAGERPFSMCGDREPLKVVAEPSARPMQVSAASS